VTTDILRPGGPPAKSVGRTEGKSVFLGTVGVRHIVDKVQAEGRFSVLEHPMSPRALASALHRHHNEDEYSWIIEGRVGALLGDEVLYGGPGDFIFKPRGQWHTFFGTRAMSPPASLRLFPPQDLSSSSTSFLSSAVAQGPRFSRRDSRGACHGRAACRSTVATAAEAVQ
jgi:mannose-6-phosphate isomerase-like protein (cupin superfamily)